MPEGPEIRRQADELGAVLENQHCDNIEMGLSRLSGYVDLLRGERILTVTSKGKAMLIHFENGLSIYSHNQLYGRWRVTYSKARPETTRQLRLVLDTKKGSALLYSASDIAVLPTSELMNHPFIAKLGPDVLDQSTSQDVIADRLISDIFSRRQLGGLLLDQHFLAGLGNYLRSEILFYAGLLPNRKPIELSIEERKVLANVIKTIPLRSYHTKGVTVPEKVYEARRANGADFEQARFSVFSKEGEPCLVCGTCIQRENRAGRRIYFCGGCQC